MVKVEEKMLKKKFREKRTSSNILWKGLFLVRDKTEEVKSSILDWMVLLSKKSKDINLKEISNNSLEGISEKYSYFGEFGYFQFSLIGGLSQYFEKKPNKKIEIVTYEDYGKILELLFPKNVKAYYTDYKFDESYRACHYYRDREFRMTLRKLGFKKNVVKDLIYITEGLSKISFESGGDFFYHLVHKLKYPLGNKLGKEKIISIFPRFRKTCTDRNLGEEEWEKIIDLLLKLKYKIIVHGYSSEFIKLKNKNLILTKNIYEQIAYLNNSSLCITPFSGFQHFAENCGCDIFVILNPSPEHLEIFKEHKKFNPFGTRIYHFKENEDYLLKLKNILRSLEGGISNDKHRQRN